MRVICLMVCLMAFALFGNGQGIKFEEHLNWKEIKAKAKSENKYILVDAFATWCVPCHKMNKEVFTDAQLGSYLNDRFISVRIQMDKTGSDNEFTRDWYKDAEQIQKKYSIEELPTFIFFNSDGELIQREVGFHEAESFLAICKAAIDPETNYAGLVKQYQKGTLKGESLLDLALTAKKYKEDSLGLAIARRYRQTVLDKQKPQQLLTPATLKIFGEFSKVYHVNDKLIQYIYRHPDEADKGFGIKGQGIRLTDFMITRDILNPGIKATENTPDWEKLELNLSKQYDPVTARRNILPAKANYYYQKKDWDTFIKCWIDKIEKNGVNMADMWGGMEVNNTVYEIIFKHSNDPYALKKGIEYMEALLKVDSNSHRSMDTYASVLYKSGEKEKALEVEQRALELAKKEKDTTSIDLYNEMISKMKEGKPTWQ